jgi:dihydroorotate dehydrogenase
LISVGGIESVDDVWVRLRAGATLVQLYSAFIYEGPLLPHRLHEGLRTRLRAAGLTAVAQIIGADA